MRLFRLATAVAAFVTAPGLALAQSPTTPARVVAVTIDDLPVASRTLVTTAEQRAVTERLLAALRAHDVPAVGFVNEGKLRRGGAIDTGRVALLRLWVRAGMELGNHTYSHRDLHVIGAGEFVRDMQRGDSVTRLVLAEVGRRPRFFRHPMLHTGRSLAARDTVDRALRSRGYAVAPVTIDNYDFQYANAYDNAVARRDSVEARRIAEAYLSYMERIFAFYEQQSVAIAGREIPQVLLLHASALNADTFDRLARMIRGRGYAFAPLGRVIADPVYRSADEYTGPAGITWLHRWAMAKGMPGSTFRGEPEVPADILAAAER